MYPSINSSTHSHTANLYEYRQSQISDDSCRVDLLYSPLDHLPTPPYPCESSRRTYPLCVRLICQPIRLDNCPVINKISSNKRPRHNNNKNKAIQQQHLKFLSFYPHENYLFIMAAAVSWHSTSAERAPKQTTIWLTVLQRPLLLLMTSWTLR